MAPNVVVTRSERGNPLIVPRGETVPVEYTRASGLADMLTVEGRQLSQWRARYAIQGVARWADLRARAASVYYSTGPVSGTQPIAARKAAAAELDAVFEEATERMGINEAAGLGTAVHALTEPENHDGIAADPLVEAAVAGYDEVTMGLERIASEVFVVNDLLRAAGTFDSAYTSPEYPGYALIGDTKSGKNYHQAEFEMQLAVYRGGEVYLGDPVMEYVAGDDRARLGGLVDQRLTFEEYLGLPIHPTVGLLVHTSITGSPKPRVVKLDLERGMRLAMVAAMTRDARREIDKVGIGEKMDHKAVARLALDAALTDVTSRDAGAALWRRFKSIWTDADSAKVTEVLGG